MNLIKPNKLKKGDKIGFVALSGTINSQEKVLNAKKYFEEKGYEVEFCENIFDKNRYLAGDDEVKVQELHRFFKDPEIKMILCTRGGYGTIRLLDKIDFNLIKNNPKIFAGYSDTSAIEAMIFKKTGLVTFYSPHAQSDFGLDKVSEFVENSFFQTLENTGELEIKPESEKSEVYFEGKAKGFLWGGNLTTVASMCGLDFIPDEKFIFFAEDLNEDVYKIDRLMTMLLNIEKFRNNVQGIILGDFLDSGNQEHLDELFFEIGKKLQKPVLSGFKITHAPDKLTVPYGAMASFSTEDKVLKIESYLQG